MLRLTFHLQWIKHVKISLTRDNAGCLLSRWKTQFGRECWQCSYRFMNSVFPLKEGAIFWYERQWPVSWGARWWSWIVRWTWTELWGWSGGPPLGSAERKLADWPGETRKKAALLFWCHRLHLECHWASCRSWGGKKKKKKTQSWC